MIFNIYFKNTFLINILIIFYEVFFTHLKSFAGNFLDIPHPCKLFASKYPRCYDSMFLSQFFIYLLFAFTYLSIAWHIPPLIPFSTSITYQYWLIILILLLSFLNKLVMLILDLIKNERDQVHIFQYTCY